MYCEGYANSEPTGPCMAGWYCTASAERANDTVNGGECASGTYCPEGSMGKRVIYTYIVLHNL